jgi:hypothetical protein
MSNKPSISWLGHGAASLAPPGEFSGVKIWAFAIDANAIAMQSLADALLNPAGNGAVKYEAFLPIALLSFLDAARCTSLTDAVGWLPGRECAIWVPLVERRPGHIFPARIVFWAPYVFINYTIGMVTGREVWGWPKVLARIGVETDALSSPEFFCSTTIFRTLNAETKGEDTVLYRVVGKAPEPKPGSLWQTAADAVSGFAASLFGDLPSELLGALQLQPALPCIALKQFRSAALPQQACFQAIVESPVALTSFTGAGLLGAGYSVEITTCESHRIVADLLGRNPDPQTTKLPVRAGAWLSGDFRALPGRDIVVST